VRERASGRCEYRRLSQQAGHPVVLTIDGKADLIVQETVSYQKQRWLAERSPQVADLGR
jgi:hypothetical protein